MKEQTTPLTRSDISVSCLYGAVYPLILFSLIAGSSSSLATNAVVLSLSFLAIPLASIINTGVTCIKQNAQVRFQSGLIAFVLVVFVIGLLLAPFTLTIIGRVPISKQLREIFALLAISCSFYLPVARFLKGLLF